MKGIETVDVPGLHLVGARSDHCPAMKGIETTSSSEAAASSARRSDHCPAMKGIETGFVIDFGELDTVKRPLPRNEGD